MSSPAQSSPSSSSSSTLLAAVGLFLFYTSFRAGQRQRQRKQAGGAAATGPAAGQRSSLFIGTRTSALALWQANLVLSRLRSLPLPFDYQIIGLNTTGDVDQIKPLSAFASKGVFTKELDTSLLEGRIDLAVHCLKDLPTVLPAGLRLSCLLERGELADAFVLNKQKHNGDLIRSLADLPAGSVIGTSALRRRAQIHRLYPHLICEEIRGNVNTRLRKLDEGQYDAIILACVGLKRLNMDDRIHGVLNIDDFGYAVGQGALAILTREQDDQTHELVEKLNHRPTMMACEAERSLLNALQGGCKVPISVRIATNSHGLMSFWAAVSSVDGKKFIEERIDGGEAIDTLEKAREWGWELARRLREKGAEDILKEIR